MKNRSIGPAGLCGVVILSQIVLVGCGKRDDSISVAEANPPNVIKDEALDLEGGENTEPAAYEAMVVNSGTDELGDTSSESPAPPKNVTGMSEDAMRIAAYEGRASVVERGLDGGIDVNSADPGKKHTALHMAAYNGHTDTVRLLLERGAEIDCRDVEGKTPLSHACTGPFAETVKLLVEKGADVNAKDTNEGFTPLMMAAALNQPEIVKILLANGADKEAVDDDQDKAIDHARNESLSEIVELLK